MKNNPVIGAVILAAGESKRLGTSKQLIQYKDKTLLHHIIESALNSKCRKIIVVIGAHADNVKKHIAKFMYRNFNVEIPRSLRSLGMTGGRKCHFERSEKSNLSIDIIENRDWTEGKASSIRLGLKALTSKSNNVNAAIFLTCDQPFISSDVIDCIIETYEKTKKTIVASKYDDTIGIPALFDRKHFSEILLLKGDQGAKSIIANYHEQVVTFSFQKGAIDIDTIEDLN